MNTSLFSEFLASNDTLWVYNGDRRLFASNKRHLVPLLEYIDKYASYQKQVTILDRIMGNAAALLSVKAAAKEVYSSLGSELAASTLVKYNIEYHLNEIASYIWDRSQGDMCPMEKLSINKSPEEFYEAAVRHLHAGT